jgi:hypothetical protein
MESIKLEPALCVDLDGALIRSDWISRTLIVATRGQTHDDSIVFALKDRASWIVAISILAVVIVSI